MSVGTGAVTVDARGVVRRFVDGFVNGGSEAVLEALVADDFVCHVGGVASSPSEGRGAWRRRAAALRAAFPDFRIAVEELIAAGDTVVMRYRGQGTHRGAYAGAAPTHARVAYTGIMIFRLRDGRLAEEWTEYDSLGLLRQIGAAPAPAAT